jgi:hypothetical protein
MSDEEYNRIFGAIPKPTFSLLFLICILVVCLLFWSVASAEDCGVSCTGTAWELEINGDVVARGLTEQECDELAIEIEPQTPPFRRMICREYEIAEQET